MARMVVVLAAVVVSGHPSLSLVAGKVHGTGFKPRERVVVHAGTAAVAVRATSLGRFVATVSFDRCSGGRIFAVGASGDRAVLRLPPTGCPPP
jgi:hypothetical protein